MNEPFRWGREWPWIAALASIGIATRVYVALHPGPFLFGDVGVFGLMAKHIWCGEDAPMFVYGQDYMGSLATWLMAPFYGILGPTFTAVLAPHVVWFALAAPVFYRLLHGLGGRWGAAVGMIAIGLGTRPLFDTAAMVGYFEMLPVAAFLYMRIDRAARLGVGAWDAAVLGSLVGGGCWINPQFVAPTVAALAALVAMSPQRLRLATSARGARIMRVVLAILLAQCAFAVIVVLSGRWSGAPFGISFTAQRPIRYAMFASAALAAAWLAVELVLSRRRWPLLVGLACVAAWQLPLAIHRMRDGDRLIRVRLDFSGEYVAKNARHVSAMAADVLVGQTSTCPALRRLGIVAMVAVVGVAGIVALVRLARELAATLRLQPTRIGIPSMLALQFLVTLFFALLFRQDPDERYIALWWLPYISALAGVAGALVRCGWWAPALLCVVVAGSHGRELAGVFDECAAPDVRPACRELAAGMVSHGVTLGYSTYDWAYMASYLADERIRLSGYGGYLPRDRASRDACARAREPVVVLDRGSADLLAGLYDVESHRIIARWSRGPFTYVQLRRPARAGGWIDELQGPPR